MSNKKNNKRVGMKYFSFFILICSLTTGLLANFTRSGDVVIDSKTALVWQDNNDTNTTERIWQESINYCESLSLDGYVDWRLPNINEFKTIIDRGKKGPAIVDKFKYVRSNIISNFYWTSTTHASYISNAWVILFYDGYNDYYDKRNSFYVRCVRGGQ